MTKIIFTRLSLNDLSILDFYTSRAKRIVPTLSVLCFILLVYGWLTPIEYEALGTNVVSSIGFF